MLKWVSVLGPYILSMDIAFLFYKEGESIISLKIKASLLLKTDSHRGGKAPSEQAAHKSSGQGHWEMGQVKYTKNNGKQVFMVSKRSNKYVKEVRRVNLLGSSGLNTNQRCWCELMIRIDR